MRLVDAREEGMCGTPARCYEGMARQARRSYRIPPDSAQLHRCTPLAERPESRRERVWRHRPAFLMFSPRNGRSAAFLSPPSRFHPRTRRVPRTTAHGHGSPTPSAFMPPIGTWYVRRRRIRHQDIAAPSATIPAGPGEHVRRQRHVPALPPARPGRTPIDGVVDRGNFILLTCISTERLCDMHSLAN